MTMKMMGKYRWVGPHCECCNYPHIKKLIRARENHTWRREAGVDNRMSRRVDTM